MKTREPEYYTATCQIAGQTYFVGRYLVTNDRDADKAARSDLCVIVSLQVLRDEAPNVKATADERAGLPSLLEAQGLTPDDIAPIYF